MTRTPDDYKGRIDGLPIETYHQTAPGFSKSALDRVHISWASYLAYRDTPKEPTPALVTGQAVHALVLEGEAAFAPFLALPEFKTTTKTGLKARETALGIQHAFQHHPTAPNIIAEGTPEVSIFWEDPETDILLKARPDWLRDDGYFMDLKTTTDAGAWAFSGACAKYRYHVQAAMIEDGCRALNIPFERLIFAAVEKEPPYLMGMYFLDSLSIEAGRQAYKEDLKRVKFYLENPGEWAGLPYEISVVSIPKWAKTEVIFD